MTAGSGQLANQMSIADDGYVFNPRDIVSEDQYGYVVRHGDHFHYILKQSVGNLAQAPSYRPTPSSNTIWYQKSVDYKRSPCAKNKRTWKTDNRRFKR